MEKNTGFSSSLPSAPSITRPRATPEMRLEAARTTAAQLCKDGHIDERDIEQLAKDIAKECSENTDGYELAKRIDRHGNWDIDRDFMEALDQASSDLEALLKAAQKRWFEENNIQPPFPIGARIKLTRWGETELGTIDEIYKYDVAKYAIKMDVERIPGARRIVNFEDCQALAEPSNEPEKTQDQSASLPLNTDQSHE